MKFRAFASWQVLAALAVLAVILLVAQRSMSARDVDVATGPPNAEQKAFFEKSVARPDLELFFKALPPQKRLAMASNLGEHQTQSAATIAAKLLSTFDDRARATLIASLTKIASQNPEFVAAELSQNGNYQRIGIYLALRSAGEKGTRAVAAALADPPRKPNAIRFLVESGNASIPFVMPLLSDEKEQTRAAAAEALGKLRATAAVEPILRNLSQAKGEERSAYFAALADIGDPRAEKQLTEALQNASPGEKARIMAGLGRIATTSSIAKLTTIHKEGNGQDRDAAVSALVLSSDKALSQITDPKLKLQIASQIHSPKADATIRAALTTTENIKEALKASRGREALVDTVWPTEGDIDHIPQRIEVLATTKNGKRILDLLKDHPTFGGYAQRALALSEN